MKDHIEFLCCNWWENHSRTAARPHLQHHKAEGSHHYQRSQLQPPKEKDLGVPFSFNTPRYFWCGKLLLLPKGTLHLFLSIQVSVIWNFNSNLGRFPPKLSIFGRLGNMQQAYQLKTTYSSESGKTLSTIILYLQHSLKDTALN